MGGETKFEVGMKVYDFRYGWGIILAITKMFVEIEFLDEPENIWEYEEIEQQFLKPYEYTLEFVKKK